MRPAEFCSLVFVWMRAEAHQHNCSAFPFKNTGVYESLIPSCKKEWPTCSGYVQFNTSYFFYFLSISQIFTCSAECPSSTGRARLPPLLPATSQTFLPSAHLQQKDQKASSTSWVLRLELPHLVESEASASTCSSHHQGFIEKHGSAEPRSLWKRTCLSLLCS